MFLDFNESSLLSRRRSPIPLAGTFLTSALLLLFNNLPVGDSGEVCGQKEVHFLGDRAGRKMEGFLVSIVTVTFLYLQ